MTERPILFSDEMVRAILDGRKTQTRRVVKLREFQRTDTPGYDFIFRDRRLLWNDYRTADLIENVCPYGTVGDRLWVRECFSYLACGPDEPGARDWGEHGIHGGDFEGEEGCERWRVSYRASGDPAPEAGDYLGWRPSIFMPRWASRIMLKITDVRVQRLQAISEDDARAEGCRSFVESPGALSHLRGAEAVRAVPTHLTTARDEFRLLWERINGAESWAANPWVWALTFKPAAPVAHRGGR